DANAVLTRLIPIEREVQDDSGQWYFTRVLPYRSTEDRIEGVVITFTEITRRLKAETALRASEERLRKMVNVEGVGVITFNSEGTLIDSNETYRTMTGYSKEEVSSGTISWRAMTPPEFIEASEAQLRKLQETGRIGPYEKQYIRKDGRRMW